MEVLQIIDTDLKRYEKRFMEASKGKKIIDTDFGMCDGIYWMIMWVKEDR